MAGISSKAVGFGLPENKIKFQKQEFTCNEFSDGSGLDMYEFKYRMDDPQIGRFWQVDPLSDKYVYNSTYAFSENHVTTHVELEGLEKFPINVSSNEESRKYQSKRLASTREEQSSAQNITTPTHNKSHSKGIQSTAAITLGSSLALDVNIEGTPISAGVNLNTFETDAIGFRDNTFTIMGHQFNGDKTGVSRKGGGGNILGFGRVVEYETGTLKNGKGKETKMTETVSVPYATMETTQVNGGQKETTDYVGFSFKAQFFIGVEFSVKVPVSGNNSGNSIPYKNGQVVDNTTVIVKLPFK
jgi:RHS repeat-associated protein